MSGEWAPPRQDGRREPRQIGRRLAIVGGAAVLSGAAAAFAVSLAPPVHRARIELTTSGAPLPGWTASEVQAIAHRAVASPIDSEPPATAFDTEQGRLDGSASRRAGIIPLSPSKAVVWAEATSAELAQVRLHAIVDQLLARAPKPAKRIEPQQQTGDPQDAAVEAERRLSEAAAKLAEAERRLAAFDAEPAAPAAATLPADSRSAAQRSALEQRRAELDAAISAVERGDERAVLPAAWGGWNIWRHLMSERRGLQPRADELAGQLEESHPRVRIVRMRLDQLNEEIARQSSTLLEDLRTQREANDAAIGLLASSTSAIPPAEADERAAQRAALVAAVDAARALLADAQAQTSSVSSTPPAQPVGEPDARPSVKQTTLPITMRSLSLWPAALAGGIAGFLGSAFFLALSRPLRAREASAELFPAAVPDGSSPEPVGRADIALIDDVIEALRTSDLSRAVVVSAAGVDSRPLSVDIGRRLALRGRSVLVVDLAEGQEAARAMGVPAGTQGLLDLVRGDASFAGIARRDFATGADIVASGRKLEGEEQADRWSERRQALDFMERSYETLVIDCGRFDAPFLDAIHDADAALLLSVEGCTQGEIDAAVQRLGGAGFADMILVRDRRTGAQ